MPTPPSGERVKSRLEMDNFFRHQQQGDNNQTSGSLFKRKTEEMSKKSLFLHQNHIHNHATMKTSTPQLNILITLAHLILLLSLLSHYISPRAQASALNSNSIPAHLRAMVQLGNNTNAKSILIPANKSNSTLAILASNQQTANNNYDLINQRKSNYFTPERVCFGTSYRWSKPTNFTEHYNNLVERYRGCTTVLGNLEIVWFGYGRAPGQQPPDMSFLDSIREVTGFVLTAFNDIETIRLPNLQIIRGRDLLKFPNDKEEYALYLTGNEIKTLELPNLREVLIGSVGSINNKNLCHINSIYWDEILNSGFKFVQSVNNELPACPNCDDACHEGACWGEGPELCQKFSKKYCASQCDQGRCFGLEPRQCCHLFCAGGCTGPKSTDCLACKNFNDDGECVQECPPNNIYDSETFAWKPNPNGKYAYGSTCVKECPDHMLRDNSACVRTCPPNKRNNNGECVSCSGPCPKNCQGVEVLHSGNIDQFTNCTVIEGSITLLESSFNGFAELDPTNSSRMKEKYPPMEPKRLEVLKTVREITGHLNIQASHPEFRNLYFLKNLRTILGRQTTDMFQSLSISATSLVSLNLRSLKEIRSGKVSIEANRKLCFADTIDWRQLNITSIDNLSVVRNADPDECREKGLVCDKQCGSGGCWGPGMDECVSCLNYSFEDLCVENCATTQSTIGILSYDTREANKTCKRCHSECRLGCRGTEDTDCKSCKNVKDGPHCVAECPIHKYVDNGICEECDKSCDSGCTGPSNKLGEGGCNSCAKAIIVNNSTDLTPVAHCIPATDECPEGFFQVVNMESHGIFKSLYGKPICRRCHNRCKSCTGMGTHTSVCTCAKYVAGEQCEDSCPRDTYSDERSRRCLRCHSECNGCFGPTENDCINCRVYRVYSDSPNITPAGSDQVTSARLTIDGASANYKQSIQQQQQSRFKCTAQCPSDKPYRISESNMLDPYCSDVASEESVAGASTGPMIGLFALVSLAAVMACIVVHRCQIERNKTVKLAMHLSGIDDVEPLNPSNKKPNLSPLISIKIDELQMGGKLGEGHSGIVYHGLWKPQGKSQEEYVAIKELKMESGQSPKELLDEAYIMNMVDHPNLVRLLGVCMTPQKSMLITQLMPLGCLAEYVSNPMNEIDAKRMLEWCKQIARGMAYLESERLVHRDLALRNVLLQTPHKVKISDFGLAKFLDADQSVYYAGGRRMPIKWLAPECIRERKFTHKSDVWAFGITIWELLTFGRKPFEEYEPKDVLEKIEGGARLHHPEHVSLDLYQVMYACWFPEADQRPSFSSLLESFSKFAADPNRYLDFTVNSETMARNDNNSDCDDDMQSEYDSDVNRFSDEKRRMASCSTMNINNGPKTPMADLTPSAMDRANEVFSFELKQHHPQESSFNQYPTTPTSKKPQNFHFGNGNAQSRFEEDVFSQLDHRQSSVRQTPVGYDMNNNNNAAFMSASSRFMSSNNDSSPSVQNTTSTVSLTGGQRSEQPLDIDDYLLPSPCSNETKEDKFSKFSASHDGQRTKLNSAPTYPRDQPTGYPRDPPHSAGLIGISNQEYFMTRVNYASPGPHGSANASSSHIPHSLV